MGREGLVSMPPRRHTALGKPTWMLWDKQELCHQRNTGSRERDLEGSARICMASDHSSVQFSFDFEREKLKLFSLSPSRAGKAGAMGRIQTTQLRLLEVASAQGLPGW